MPNDTVRFGRTGTQDEPIAVKKNAGAIDGKPEAAENINWFLDRVAAGANLDRREDCLLYLPLNNNLNIDIGVGSSVFSRASTGTYIGVDGLLKVAAIDEPRFEANGLLIEGASTNLLLRSEELDNGAWTLSGTPVIVADAIDAPDGATTAETLEDDDAGVSERIDQSITVADDSNIHSVSIFLKRLTPQPDFTTIKISYSGGSTVAAAVRLSWATESTSTIEGIPLNTKLKALSDGWFRLSFGLANNTSGNTVLTINIFIAGVAVSNVGKIGAWGAQIEKLPFTSSYIPTVGATVTRLVDIFSVDIANNIGLQANAGTILCDVAINGKASLNIAFDITGETSRTILPHNSFVNDLPTAIWGGAEIAGSAIAIGDVVRYGVVHNGAGGISFWQNGTKNSSTSGSDVSDALGTLLNIGVSASGTTHLWGNISGVRILKRGFIDQEMAMA